MDFQEREQQRIEALHGILKVARETEEIGAETCMALYDQEKQLDRINDKEHEIQHNIQKSNRLVRGMKSIGGRIKNLFSKKPKFEIPQNQEGAARRPNIQICLPNTQANAEEDKCIDELNLKTENLMNIAMHIGDTLERQNVKIDALNEMTYKNNAEIKSVKNKTKELLW